MTLFSLEKNNKTNTIKQKNKDTHTMTETEFILYKIILYGL